MRSFAILLLAALCACKSNTQYNTTVPGNVHAPSRYVLVGTSDSAGVYFTNNQGVTWQRANIDLSGGQKVWGFATWGSETYCTSPGAGVFLSTDSGVSWVKLQYPGRLPQGITVFDSALYVADNLDGLYVSSDHGFSWNLRGSQLIGSYVHGFVSTGTTLLASTERRGIAVSQNHGIFWNANDTNQTGVKDVHSLAVNSTGIYGGASLQWLLRSTDQGVSWQSVSFSNAPQNVWALLSSDSMMYAGTSQGVFRSPSKGVNWSPFTATLASEDVHSLAFDGANLYAGTIGDGVFRSADKGFTWLAASTGLVNRTVSAMIVR
jgi:hypothetical protein